MTVIRIASASSVIVAFACAALSHPTTGAAADRAEYAARWDAASGGPGSLEEVRLLLGLPAGKQKDYVIQYFTVPQPLDLPATFKATGRERTKSGDTEATYKIRGDTPQDAYLSARHCPLTGTKPDTKVEVDVIVTPEGETRMYSFSCSVDGSFEKASTLESGVKPKHCKSRMTRLTANKIKMERWEFENGNVLFDISWNATTDPADLESFRKRVMEPLATNRGNKPPSLVNTAKTELGDC